MPLSEQWVSYCISILADLTQGTSQGVAGILHGGRLIFTNHGIMVDRNSKAPVDFIPGGINPGILLLIVEQEDNGHAHFFHSNQKTELYWGELVYTMNHDTIKGLLSRNTHGSFATLDFLWSASTLFDFLLCEANNNLLELLTGRSLGEPE